MSTFNADIARLSDDELAAIEVPEFERVFVKQQPAGERKFAASGAKADLIVRYVLHGGYSRDQIAYFTQASPSRVGEVVWAMDAASVSYPPLARKRSAKADAEGDSTSVPADKQSAPTASKRRKTTAA